MRIVVVLALFIVFALAIASRYGSPTECDRKEVVIEENENDQDL
jgi:hypothetical protein